MTESFGGVVGWLREKLRGSNRAQPHLALVERIALGPRQSLALVEAEGRRILVATSAEGGPAFYPLDVSPKNEASVRMEPYSPVHDESRRQPRVSW